MILNKINSFAKCDTVLCNQTCTYELVTNSYKGNIYLCENCFKELTSLFKRNSYKNETKE
ncbi:MAG: hypothetical protein IJ538_02200 [Clostridia bacterium]|nr:hypothetical protein [Clostridia bacterium]